VYVIIKLIKFGSFVFCRHVNFQRDTLIGATLQYMRDQQGGAVVITGEAAV